LAIELVTLIIPYFFKRGKGRITALIIYVDNMIVTENDQDEISSLQQYLASEFDMKQLGNLKYFLDIEVARSKHDIFLCQRKYTIDLLSKTRLLGSKPVDTPIEQNHKLFQCSNSANKHRQKEIQKAGRKINLFVSYTSKYYLCSECC